MPGIGTFPAPTLGMSETLVHQRSRYALQNPRTKPGSPQDAAGLQR